MKILMTTKTKVYVEEQIPSILAPPFMVPKPLAQNHIQDLTLKSPMQIKQLISSPKYYTYSTHFKCAINRTYFNCSFMVHKEQNQTTTHQKCQKANKCQTSARSHNLFIQTFVGQINDTTSLAKTMASLESHKWQKVSNVEYSSLFNNNT